MDRPLRPLLALAVCAAFLVAGCAQPPEAPSPTGDGLETFGEAPDGQPGGAAGSAGSGGSGGGPSGSGGTSGSAASMSGSCPPPPPPGTSPTGPPPSGCPPPPSGSMSMSQSSGSGSMPSGGGSTGGSTGGSGGGQVYAVGRALHEATWLCQTAISVQDYTPAGTDGLQCHVTLSFTDTTVTVVSTGIPNHNYESGSGCCAETQSSTKTFPLNPQIASTVTYPSQRGSIATAVNGVAIFGPEDSNGEDVVIATYSDPNVQPRLEMCDAHSEPMSGTYHYHADGNCIHYHGDMQTYDFSKVDSSVHSGILGFAPDGFPIYGSYGYADDNVTIREITSSYRLKAGADGSNGQEDQEYIEGLGDLDECNGKVGPTPEFPDGIYHYYSTKHNGEGGWGFPYFPLCYRGVVTSSGGGGGGGGGGGMTTSGSMSGTTSGGMPPPPGGGGGGGGGGMPPPP